MALDYVNLRDNVAERLIRENGKVATLTFPAAQETGDKPWRPSSGEPDTLSVYVVETQFTFSERASTLVEQDDIKLMLSTEGLTTDPTPATHVTVDGETFHIISMDKKKPGGTAVYWTMHCRK